jgi:RNA recognition motif-containing protein
VAVRLFIGNLPYGATDAELREHFASVGAPTQIVIPVDRDTGRPRGFAFVDFSERPLAEEAIRRFNGQPFKGRMLAVSEARPREERGPGGFSPRPPGGGFAPRPPGGGFPPRPPRAEGDGAGAPAGRARNFGPDAKPARQRRPTAKQQQERGPKGPIPERYTGRIFDPTDDEAGDEPVDFDNFATSAGNSDVSKDVDKDADQEKEDDDQ